MKVRRGFMSNCSSSTYTIVNKTDRALSLADFVFEASDQVVRELESGAYDSAEAEPCLGEVMASARQARHWKKTDEYFLDDSDVQLLTPGLNYCEFGREGSSELVGLVLDFALRQGGETTRAQWRLVSVEH